MNEEKLYAVKNDEGEFLSFSEDGCSVWHKAVGPFQTDKQKVREWAYGYGGHVVTLVEEPKKRVLTKEQAQIIENARKCTSLTGYISQHCADSLEELLLVSAYVNGYSVQKDKKYNVKVPHAEGWHFQKYSPESKRGLRNNWRPFPAKDVDSNMSKDLFLFTESEIEHYGLQDCEKEEVTDDDE